jgi:hypothetical protein
MAPWRPPMALAPRGAEDVADQEPSMTLDDIYGSDNDRFPLEQETAVADAAPSRLVWDEPELRLIVARSAEAIA